MNLQIVAQYLTDKDLWSKPLLNYNEAEMLGLGEAFLIAECDLEYVKQNIKPFTCIHKSRCEHSSLRQIDADHWHLYCCKDEKPVSQIERCAWAEDIPF